MKRHPFLNRNDGGMALITVVLSVALILALFVMGFTNGIFGKVITETRRTARTAAICAQGDLSLASQIVLQWNDNLDRPPWVVISADIGAEIGGDPDLGSLAADDGVIAPDMTIINPAQPGCVTTVDVDFLFHDPGEVGAVDDGYGYHETGKGIRCEPGDFYSITAVTTTVGLGGASSNVQSIFCRPA